MFVRLSQSLHTSVEVPPMSKPQIGSFESASNAVTLTPTTPPAGPERIAREPMKLNQPMR